MHLRLISRKSKQKHMKGLTVFNWMFNAFHTNRLTNILYAPRSTGGKHCTDSSAQSCSNDKIWPDRSQAHSHLLINTTLLLNVFNPCMDDVSAWTSAELLLLKCNYGSLQWQDTAIAFAGFLTAALSWKCWYIQITERIWLLEKKISWSMLSFTFRPLVTAQMLSELFKLQHWSFSCPMLHNFWYMQTLQ